MTRLFARRRDSAGFTLVEVMVGMVMMTAIVGIVGPMMISAMNATSRVELQSRAVDELRLSVQQIGRELRSAVCIKEPHFTSDPTQTTGTVLDFTTDANNVRYEVVYAIANGKLTRAVNSTTGTVASDVTSGLFTQFSTPRRSVSMTFTVQVGPKQKPDSLTTTIAGRNAWRSNCT